MTAELFRWRKTRRDQISCTRYTSGGKCVFSILNGTKQEFCQNIGRTFMSGIFFVSIRETICTIRAGTFTLQ